MTTTLISFVVGLMMLGLGGRWLVSGSSGLARRLGIPSIVVGLTVVAFGTSAPELAVSIRAAMGGSPDIALGNVVGSNICNVLLILGLCAVVRPLAISSRVLLHDLPMMIVIYGLFWVLGRDGSVSRVDGLVFVAILLGWIAWTVRQSRREVREVKQEFDEVEGSRDAQKSWLQIVMIIAGLVLLTVGASLLVDSAVTIAKSAGISELVIGLTIIAVGTSLPEVAASFLANLRDEPDIALGNVIGSNLFNILCVLGLTALVSPGGIAVTASASNFDLPVMIVTGVVCLPMFYNHGKLTRWEGLVFLIYYGCYLAFLVLSAMDHPILERFNEFVLAFILVPTLLTVCVGVVRTMRAKALDKQRDGIGTESSPVDPQA